MKLNMDQLRSGVMQKLLGVVHSLEQTQAMDALQTKLVELITESVSWEKTKLKFVLVYFDAFTENDLDEMIMKYVESLTAQKP